jgi:type II secretory pathway pseudopilin PulG
MKPVTRRQSGVSLIELAVVFIIMGVLLTSVLQSESLADRAKVRNLIRDFRSVQFMLEAYRTQFGAIPGDDPGAAIHVGGTESNYKGDGLINGFGNWTGATSSASTIEESPLFWQHVRLAGLSRGNPTRGYAKNILGGYLGITSSAGRHPNRPAGIRGLYVICSSGIDGRLARQVDVEMDDGVGTTGRMFASAEPTPGAAVVTGVPTNSYDDVQTFTVCWVI